MTLDDLYSIQNVLFSEFDDFWTISTFKQELECKNSHFIIAQNDAGQILGFAGFKAIIDEADIMNIVVKKDCRNNGIGSFLLENLLSLASKLNIIYVNLEVHEKNISAISLYKKLGFKEISIRKNYYNGTDNAIIMQKKI
jgi:ribosomal-protein-alanine N-acetyltransferase